MERLEARKALKRLINAKGRDYDLAEAALLVACEADPALDPAKPLALLDAWATELSRREGQLPVKERLLGMARFLAEEQGLKGNLEDYYAPDNSFLDKVLEKRQGIPISLSVVYLAVAQRLGLPLAGIPLPGHFLVAPVGQDWYLDPFEGGRMTDRKGLEAILKKLFGPEAELDEGMLKPMPKRQILARMVRNLRYIYSARQETPQLLWATDLGLALEPTEVILLKERGLAYYQLNRFHDALHDLRSWLKHSPAPPDEDEDPEESPGRQHVELLYRVLSAMN